LRDAVADRSTPVPLWLVAADAFATPRYGVLQACEAVERGGRGSREKPGEGGIA